MGKVEDAVPCQVPSERLPLLCQAASSPTYLSQEEVVQQASAAPWQGLRRALLCLLGVAFACVLAAALLLLLTMPRPPPPLGWWQRASFYHLPTTAFPDSNGDGNGDLRAKQVLEAVPKPAKPASQRKLQGVRPLLDQLVELPVQALVLGSVLEGDSAANLTTIYSRHGSLEQLRALVADGRKQGIRILLELPTWAEGMDLAAEDNRTARHLKRALQFWQAQGVNGFLVAKEPAWRLDAVLNAWSDLSRQKRTSQAEEGVLLVWDQSGSCNISRWVPSRVILTCNLPGTEKNLTAGGLTQQVEAALQYPRGPWPGWTVATGLPLTAGSAEALGVLLLSLPGTPLLQGGAGSAIRLGNTLKPSMNGHPLTTLYQSLLPVRARSFALQGASFAPLPLTGHSEDIFAFLRPGSCSGILVVLNLGSQPCQLNLSQPSFPIHAKVLFSSPPEPQSEVKMEEVELAPHQALLLRVN